ncbi:hypothetical protein [Thermococcus sp. Bubb.Bath]|uniref:hypothetical protein n=1 Tax=Thermococcus sp. Bubb.Bath TaxID=1638242 RepID=UPI00168E6B63|nr:hypothetical protein [Thermococcus sp. Bubb.Bath]NJF25292.1 hypothetical protein [Thermococcus sp. Bubb.Bath]
MVMEDILVPMEREDAVVLIGVDPVGNVEFVRVYAVSEELAKKTLERFFNARGLFPADYLLVSSGTEDVGDREAITTRTESSLSSALSRLGLKLLSNGVLHLGDAKTVYQITMVSESLYNRIVGENEGALSGAVKDEEPSPEEMLSLGVSVLVENLAGVDISQYIPPEAILLREPPVEKVAELLDAGSVVIVETKNADKYYFLDFPAVIRIPPLSVEEFAAELSSRLGMEVDSSLFSDYPPERLNLKNVDALAELVGAIVAKFGVEKGKALQIALRFNRGGW